MSLLLLFSQGPVYQQLLREAADITQRRDTASA